MRYTDLHIQTQRESPANARSEGHALLVRAGYLSHAGALTPLGQHCLARLHTLAESSGEDFFNHLGLKVIGKNDVFFPFESGPVEAIHCPSCGYAARQELAVFKKTPFPPEPLLPAEKVLTPDCHTIETLANFLGIPQEKTAKALMFTRLSDGKFIFVVVRGDMTLSEAKLKNLVGEFRLASAAEIIQAGAEPGYASPIGLRESLIVVDDLIPQSPNLAAGANEAGYHLVNTNYGRDYTANQVADLALAHAGAPCFHCGNPLTQMRAILLKEDNTYYFEAILSALAETHHDDKGLTFPPAGAPFDIYLMHVPGKMLDTLSEAEKIYASLQAAGLSVLFDDRNERAGVKFNDADLIGCPLRVTAGERALQNNMVELKPRLGQENLSCPLDELPLQARRFLDEATQ